MPADAEATRRSILAAAREHFAAHGLAGARVDRIAAGAGCNKERIYAWFGDKEQLYRRVVGDMLEEMRQATIVEIGQDPGAYVRRSFDFHREHPGLLRMLLWEALECTDGELPDDRERRDCYTLSAKALLPHADGDDESRMLLFTLIGMTAWSQAVPTLARVVTDDESDTPAGQDRLREFVAGFTEAALSERASRRTSRTA